MANKSNDDILFRTTGHVAIITINMPKQLNAMTQTQYFRIAQLLRQIAEMDDIYVTVLTAKGRFFSACVQQSFIDISALFSTYTYVVQALILSSGANVRSREVNTNESGEPDRNIWVRTFGANNMEVGQAFSTHPKILVAALNGPVVGVSAALIAQADFIYAMPHTFLLTPFSSLGLVAEGGSSVSFVQRMGLSKANEALIMSKRISCEELVQCGFVNAVFEGKPGEDEKFLERVLEEVDQRLSGGHLNPRSLLLIKKMIRRPFRQVDEAATMTEVMVGLEGFMKNIPQQEFAKVASGQKRHKL